ncbi:hypothetical protein [Methylomonas sp. UP202]|uniref:hypothetical protein n=1 Tax=Methylomonas sp. UP202 TaxID=3040943 RepID=UPI00247AECC5|nr:hypothetical protein [Methylomonas sp. UP202]WGS86473.1 hypothetical protein QC632_01620 [Methylomonas sp. UP202]
MKFFCFLRFLALLLILLVNTAIAEGAIDCPEKVFTEQELTVVVKQLRESRSDLPQAFKRPLVRVSRLRCLYLYFEYNDSDFSNNYNVFTFDPYGELVEFSVTN